MSNTEYDCRIEITRALDAGNEYCLPPWGSLVLRVRVLYAMERQLRESLSQAREEIAIMRRERDSAARETAQHADSELLRVALLKIAPSRNPLHLGIQGRRWYAAAQDWRERALAAEAELVQLRDRVVHFLEKS